MSTSPSPASVSPSRPWRNVLEGAAAGLCAVLAMAAVAAIALAIFDPQSANSVWALTMAVTALAVGGSLTIGPDTMPAPPEAAAQGGTPPGGSAANLTMSGAAHVVPIAVTLVGAVVLWLVFSRRMRQRPFSTGELVARAIGAVATAVLALLLAATLGHGTFKLPSSADSASLGGKLGELVEKLFGAGGLGGGAGAGAAAQPPMSYDVNVGATVVGGLVWAVIVLVVGLLISRRAPVGFTARGLRPALGPSFSAVVRTLLVVAAVMTITGAVAAGDHKASGGALLLAPVALSTALSLGLGSTWTSSSHQVQSPGAAAGAPSAGAAAGQQPTAAVPPDHTQHVGDLTAAGMPVWVVSLVITALLLLGCAYAAARATDPEHARPLHPYRGPMARHLGLAERFGVVTAVVLGGAAALAQTSFHVSVSTAGHAVGGSEMRLGGGVLWTFVAGLLAGAVAGFVGSLLVGERAQTRSVRTRRSPVAVGGPPVASNPVEPGA